MGYAVVAVNFHGSTGFGQTFCDSIRGDWGGQPFRDVMAAVDWAVATFDWIDGGRVAALGASYGGYMMNWINGHTQRFEVVVVVVVLALVVDFGCYDDGDVSANKKCKIQVPCRPWRDILSPKPLLHDRGAMVSLPHHFDDKLQHPMLHLSPFLIQVSGVGIWAAFLVG